MEKVKAKSILVADDSLFFREKLSDALENAGHHVKKVKDGQEAINELTRDRNLYDLMILDLKMPEKDGFEVLDWMENTNRLGAPEVMIVTGACEPDEVLKRLKWQGVNMVLTKEVSPEQIVYTVNRLLFDTGRPAYAPARIPISSKASFVTKEEDDGRGGTGTVLNISETGLYVKTRSPINKGGLIDMKFSLLAGDGDGAEGEGEEQEGVRVKGEVVWTGGLKAETAFFRGAGVRFTEVSAKDMERIKGFMETTIMDFLMNH